MRRKTALSLLLLLFFIVILYCMENEPHRFSQGECPTCHVTDRSGSIIPHQMTLRVSALCSRCHADILSEGYAHPVDIRPQTVRIPSDMPLSMYGELTCSTCHDVHSSYFTPYGAPSHFLRRYEVGSVFCEICHGRSRSLSSGHKGTFGQAHVKMNYKVTDASSSIDPISANCISCHDGSFASSVSIGAGVWSHGKDIMRFDKGVHPIGADYETVRVTRRNSFLKPMSLVDRRIRFFDGKIGCASCHDPFSQIESGLVMSDKKSQLCLSCHEMGR